MTAALVGSPEARSRYTTAGVRREELEQGTPVAGGTAMDIRLELYVLDPAVVVGGASAADRFAIGEQIWLRPLGTSQYARNGGPYVMSFSIDFARDMAAVTIAEALWEFLRPRRGGRGVVTARVMRRREVRRVEEPGGTPVIDRHELWFAIPLRSNRGARRQIDAFFAEVLPAGPTS
jgi:hypothetical protein